MKASHEAAIRNAGSIAGNALADFIARIVDGDSPFADAVRAAEAAGDTEALNNLSDELVAAFMESIR